MPTWSDDELDDLPKDLLRQLSARTVGPYAVKVRAERNTYRNLYEAQKRKAESLAEQLRKARGSCKRMAKELSAND